MNPWFSHLVRVSRVFPAMAIVCAATWAAAGPASPKVEVSVTVEREAVRVDASGNRHVERTPVQIANPGDVLVYTVKAQNTGDAPALDASLEDPLPGGTELIVESLESGAAAPSASLDGGRTWQPFPAKVERRSAEGKVETVAAPPSAYTHLRWTLAGPLGPGESKDVRFKGRVL